MRSKSSRKRQKNLQRRRNDFNQQIGKLPWSKQPHGAFTMPGSGKR